MPDVNSSKTLICPIPSPSSPSWTMGQLYNERKSDDGFLYAHYSGENSFGV